MKEVKFTKIQSEEISEQVLIRIDSIEYENDCWGGIMHDFENSEQDMYNLLYALQRNTRNVFTDMEIDYMIHLVEDAIEPLYSNEMWGGVRSLNNALKKMGC